MNETDDDGEVVATYEGWGVTPPNSPKTNACIKKPDFLNVQCDTHLNEARNNDFVGIVKHFESACVGQKSCKFDLRDPAIMGSNTIDATQFEDGCNAETA